MHPERACKRDGYQSGQDKILPEKLIEKGWVKATNSHLSQNKKSYVYLLTPTGTEEKGELTISFLQHKMEEYELLKTEIMHLREEIEQP